MPAAGARDEAGLTQAIQTALARERCRAADDKVLHACAGLASSYNLKPEELANKYDEYLFGLSSGGSRQITLKSLKDFEGFLKETKGKENRGANNKKHPRPETVSWEDLPAETPFQKKHHTTPTITAAHTPRTPAITPIPALTPLISPPPSAGGSSTFKSRQDRGKVTVTVNAEAKELAVTQAQQQGPRSSPLTVAPIGPTLTPQHRYMVEPLEAKAGALADRMQRFADHLEEALGQAPSHPVNAVTQAPELMAGRVCCDSEGRLNEQSVLLEGLVGASEGARVPVDLSALPSFRLFPGQVIGVRGINPSSQKLIAHTVYPAACPPLCPPPATPPTRPTSIVAAAGPFTVASDTDFAPLEAVLEYCSTAKPDVLMLLGPFVDSQHPAVTSGLLQVTFQELFQQQVEARLKAWVEAHGSGTKVLIVPSVRDVHGAPTYPQPPLALHPDLAARGVSSVQNPATMELEGGLVLGATAEDVVKHLSGSQAQRGPESDRLRTLCSHLPAQRSYYPLYPPPAGTCMDTTQYRLLDMPCTPSILLLPSDLAAFAKLVPAYSGTPAEPTDAKGVVLCVNPGRAAKGESGGTLAHIRMAAGEGGLEKLASVEIVRV